MENLSQRAFEPVPLPSAHRAELRVFREEDVTPDYVKGMNDPEVRRFVSVGRGELSEDSIKGFAANNWNSPHSVLFGLFVDEAHCGNVRLHDYDGATAWMGIALFDRSIWGKGYGSAAIDAASGFAFERLGCKTVQAGVDPGNQASVRAFMKAHFSIAGQNADGLLLIRYAEPQSESRSNVSP